LFYSEFSHCFIWIRSIAILLSSQKKIGKCSVWFSCMLFIVSLCIHWMRSTFSLKILHYDSNYPWSRKSSKLLELQLSFVSGLRENLSRFKLAFGMRLLPLDSYQWVVKKSIFVWILRLSCRVMVILLRFRPMCKGYSEKSDDRISLE
jgi:hypothetical protein